MSLLRAAFAPRGDQRVITSLPWLNWLQGGDSPSRSTQAGVHVTAEKALGVAIVWGCIVILADLISRLPVDVYEKSVGVRTQIEPEPLLVRKPSLIYTRREWLFQAVVSAALWGNIYGLETVADEFGFAENVEIVHPSVMAVTQESSLAPPEYRLNGRLLDFEKVHHLRRFLMPGSAIGMAPLDRQKETIGFAIAARDYASRWFRDGAHPSGLLTTDADLDDPTGEKAKTVKTRFIESMRGRREPAVIGGGWKYKSTQATPSDSQLDETWNRIGIEVCNALGLPPEVLGIAVQGSSITYANRDQRALDLLVYRVEPWLNMFEDWWTDNLPGQQFAKFNTGALLRVDVLTQHRVLDLATRMGLQSINESRTLLDLSPVDGRDEPLWPPYRTQAIPPEEGIDQ